MAEISPNRRAILHQPRELSDRERTLAHWMIEHGSSIKKDLFLQQLDEAKIIRLCPCGCESIDFLIPSRGEPKVVGLTMLGDFAYGSKETGLCGAFIFSRGDILAGLEVYSIDGRVAAPTLPSVEELESLRT
jgi:hypothetical protein